MTSLCNYNDVMQHLSRFATEMQQEIRAETVARTTEGEKTPARGDFRHGEWSPLHPRAHTDRRGPGSSRSPAEVQRRPRSSSRFCSMKSTST
jgi:hypothetical protein